MPSSWTVRSARKDEGSELEQLPQLQVPAHVATRLELTVIILIFQHSKFVVLLLPNLTIISILTFNNYIINTSNNSIVIVI